MSVVTVYAVFADPAEAQRIGRTIVEERLAACVNILGPCRSIYRWEGAIEMATETPALFKTTSDKADALIERVKAMHSYSIPALAIWPIERLPADYADWVEAEVR
jgi:periplasmic divalent cation tolerance protein